MYVFVYMESKLEKMKQEKFILTTVFNIYTWKEYFSSHLFLSSGINVSLDPLSNSC